MKTNTSLATILNLSAISAAILSSAYLATATPEMEPEGDFEVSEFIQMEIYHDAMMEGAEVNVTIEGGIATLTGSAKSLAQVERASAKVFANPEVLTVVNRLRISPVSADKIASDASQMLANQGLLDAGRVTITAKGSRIILEGEVGIVDEGELVRELVSETTGATSVENRLLVNFQEPRTDSQITAQLAYTINDDPIFAGLDLAPAVKDGVVKWDGEVGSRAEFDRIVRKSFVTGVIDVDTEKLRVNGDLAVVAVEDKDYTPSQSLEALIVSLKHDPRLSTNQIAPTMNQGVITLTGVVASASQSEAAELAARCIPGVLRVSNQLVIERENRLAKNRNSITSASAPVLKR